MKKLYYAKKEIDVVFQSNNFDEKLLLNEALFFLKEEDKNIKLQNSLILKEIISLGDVPKEWYHAIAWNQEGELIVAELIDPEYHEYLRLKEKFE